MTPEQITAASESDLHWRLSAIRDDLYHLSPVEERGDAPLTPAEAAALADLLALQAALRAELQRRDPFLGPCAACGDLCTYTYCSEVCAAAAADDAAFLRELRRAAP